MSNFETTPPIPYVEIGTQAAEVRLAIDAARLSAANSFGGLQKLAIPGPFATDAEASTGGVPDDNLYYRSDGTVRAASHISLDLAFALDKTLTARTGPTPTFTRASGATYVGSDGLIHGIDTSTTSVTFGTGSKTVTLSAPLGQDQMWRVGNEVEIVNTAGALMFGIVTSYTASSQELVCNITSSTGTGTFTTWRIGYRGARFDHDPATGVCKGLLIEESRTNLLLRSEEFDNVYWTKSGLLAPVPDSGTAPSGAITADLLIEDTGSAQHRIHRDVAVVNGGTYTASVFVKRGAGSRQFGIIISSPSVVARVYFNIDTETVATTVAGSGTIKAFPNGWYLCTATGTVASTSATVYLQITNGTASGTETYTGDGTSGLYLWGAQLEAGAFPLSYIPTTSGTAARSADVSSIIGDDFSSFYNQSEGTAVTKVTNAAGIGTTTQYPFSFSGATAVELLIALRTTPAKDCRFASVSSNVDTLVDSANAGTLSDRATDIIGFAIKLNDFAGSLDGNLITDSTVTLPTVDRMFIGSRFDGTRHWGGHIARIQYFRKRLSNAKLQTLTAP